MSITAKRRGQNTSDRNYTPPYSGTCFGGPFMVHHPLAYAELLKKKIQKHGAHVWLVNTGWTGGPFGVGKRISIHHTRALLNAALSGALVSVEYK